MLTFGYLARHASSRKDFECITTGYPLRDTRCVLWRLLISIQVFYSCHSFIHNFPVSAHLQWYCSISNLLMKSNWPEQQTLTLQLFFYFHFFVCSLHFFSLPSRVIYFRIIISFLNLNSRFTFILSSGISRFCTNLYSHNIPLSCLPLRFIILPMFVVIIILFYFIYFWHAPG